MYTKDSNVLSHSKLTVEQLKHAVDSYVPGNNLHGILSTAAAAEKHYGINALFVVAHAAVESGWGRSTFARTRNNFFGFNAVDSNPNNASTYKTAEKGAQFYVEFLRSHYLTKGGKYYEGTTIHDIFKHYSSSHDVEAATIAQIMNTLAEKAGVVPDGFPQTPPKKNQEQHVEKETPKENTPPTTPAETAEPSVNETAEETEPAAADEPATDTDTKKN